ncbi:hypothetical protein ASG01_14750 [Chryseobacterium sp. Leaf180]|uniref:helix-turn-helix domain-containing protein n=1 Tax=Chryseobacterium sp. Leaf180 TaxID=1736289 RepID=UPI0006F26843|nr:helix-turn-helix domain-containing protein [Chryseobacterium sp. Leaf180]KQR90821.1 hypothetical protein ASG01_14750 [Chryseobacterium sp. Leaf180]
MKTQKKAPNGDDVLTDHSEDDARITGGCYSLENVALSDFMDGTDVRNLLHISDSTLRRMRKSGQLPCIRIGKKYYYPKPFFQTAFKV